MSMVVSWALSYLAHSTLIVFAVWLATRLTKDRWLLEDRLWKMALVGGALTATLQLGLGVDPLLGVVELAAPEAAPAPAVEPIAGASPRLVVVDAVDDRVLITEPATPSGVSSPVPDASAAPHDVPTPWPSVVGWLLLAGSLLGLARFAYRWGRLMRRLRYRRRVFQGPLLAALRELAGEEVVALSISRSLSVPIAFGLMEPEIVVPERITELAPDEQRAMLAHELAHLRRGDPSWLVLASLAGAVLFFQPLNLLVRRRMERCAELLCDDWATRRTGDRMALARCLSEVAAWVVHDRDVSAVAPAMAAHRSELTQRVAKLLDDPPRSARRIPRGAAVAVALLLATLVWAVPSAAITPVAPEKPSVDRARLDARLEEAIDALADVREELRRQALEQEALLAEQRAELDEHERQRRRPKRERSWGEGPSAEWRFGLRWGPDPDALQRELDEAMKGVPTTEELDALIQEALKDLPGELEIYGRWSEGADDDWRDRRRELEREAEERRRKLERKARKRQRELATKVAERLAEAKQRRQEAKRRRAETKQRSQEAKQRRQEAKKRGEEAKRRGEEAKKHGEAAEKQRAAEERRDRATERDAHERREELRRRIRDSLDL